MITYTRVSINLLSFFITIFFTGVIHLFLIQGQSFSLNKQSNSQVKCIIAATENKPKEAETRTVQTSKKAQTQNNKSTWKIIIPAIQLEANIAEGATQEVMNKYVAHFENTPKLNGNVALAAHNRGYAVNYFRDLKKLKKGDIIQYIYGGVEKKYRVEVITVIKDTDWTYLQNTTKDKITLITCVENQPEYRRCIQGVIIN